MTLAITRTDLTAEDLRRAARSSKDVAQARRCLAIASVLDGGTRTAAAESAGMQRQTLRDWVHRYNAHGLAGLRDRSRPARPGLLNAEQLVAFDRIMEAGPDVTVDGVVRWRRVDLKQVVERRFGVVMNQPFSVREGPKSVSRVLTADNRGSRTPSEPSPSLAHLTPPANPPFASLREALIVRSNH